MTRPSPAGLRHCHPLAAVQTFRSYLVLALLPLLNALIQWDLGALHDALVQNAVLLTVLAVLSVLQTLASGWILTPEGVLVLHKGLLVHQCTRLHGRALAALRLEQPPHCRLLGAARLTLYCADAAQFKPITLYLHRRDAQMLADALLPEPAPENRVSYRPAGSEWLRFVLLSANAAATGSLAALALRQSSEAERYAEQLALEQVGAVARFAARWLPAGLAWLLAAAGLLLCGSLARSLLRMGGYCAASDGKTLWAGGGLLTVWQTRVRTASLRWTDVRRTPSGRLLRCWPVYVAAGSCDSELPLAVLRPGDTGSLLALQTLLPGFELPPAADAHHLAHGRSTAAFFGVSGGLFGSLLTLTLLARQFLPAAAPLLALLTAVALTLVLISEEGRRTEGGWPGAAPQDKSRRTDTCILTARRVQCFTLHSYCIYARPMQCRLRQSPWAVRAHRADLTLYLPSRVRLRLRSLPLEDAEILRKSV